jgi:hypothetical protein
MHRGRRGGFAFDPDAGRVSSEWEGEEKRGEFHGAMRGIVLRGARTRGNGISVANRTSGRLAIDLALFASKDAMGQPRRRKIVGGTRSAPGFGKADS